MLARIVYLPVAETVVAARYSFVTSDSFLTAFLALLASDTHRIGLPLSHHCFKYSPLVVGAYNVAVSGRPGDTQIDEK